MGLNTQNRKITNDRMLALSAIIPAYNECDRIANNLSVLIQSQFLDEIIVVDDGSTDGMDSLVQKIAQGEPRLKLVRHPNNLGKGQAIFSGLQTTTAPVALMLDADLIGLTVSHVEALAQPVLAGEADMTIGLFKHGGFWTDLSHFLTPWLSGQRCLRTALLKDVPPQASQGYGFETCLTILARQHRWRLKRVPWYGVSHPLGHRPRSGLSGFRRKTRMYRDILRTWLVIEFSSSWPGRQQYKIDRRH